ncbi:helix-turn-helix domain-containing protein [Paludicola sp. MB14-C6]|uniref:helix-turn-helix domain-containing protein n=1 Tax=Paludihabitans sp. MB14-C6 TaxID=3070656 RepID=UPI0027DB0E47|nr:helix-turn-helix domain-containing protein [Paludicola sp. MB14-C6]WMJ22680.1 helix-turn-helix domain-containing protein [Paludicola sp. MB14-C6]
MKYIKLPNKIFLMNLSPIDILVFAGLKYLDKHNNNQVIAKAQNIALACGLHRNSVTKAIKSLEEKRIIRKVNRYSDKGYRISNSYYLASVSKKYFLLPVSIFTYNLTPSTFAVYCYILKCSAHHSKRAFPSLKKIAAHTGVCLDTAITAIKALLSNGLINKEYYVTIENDFGCNNYTVLTVLIRVKGYIKKKVARLFSQMRTTIKTSITLMIQHSFHPVNTFHIFSVLKNRKLYLFYLGVLEKMCNIY